MAIMKKLQIFLLSCFLCSASFAGFVKITASGGSPIPTAYSTSDSQSAALTARASKGLTIHNQTGSQIAYSRGESDAAPSADDGVVPGGAVVTRDNFGISNNSVIFIRSDSGLAITDDLDVVIETW